MLSEHSWNISSTWCTWGLNNEHSKQ